MQREVPSSRGFCLWYSRGTAWAEAGDSTATVLCPQQRWHQGEERCWGKQTCPFVPIHVLSSLCSRLRQGERGWISREGDWPFPGEEKANTSAQTCGKQTSQKGWEKQHWLLQGSVLRGSALCRVTSRRRFSLREGAEHLWEPKEKLHSSPRGQRTVLLQEGRGSRSSKEEHCCSNSSCKASHTPPRALRLQSCSWTRQDKNLPCSSHAGFGGFLVWSLIACARWQEDTIPLCDATWEYLALLWIISWEISNFLYSHSRKLLFV